MTTSTKSADHEQIGSFIKTIADESCQTKLTGIAIGVIVDGQELSAVSGWADIESKRPVSDATIFEIGSLSKLFTSLLLAVAATKREVSLDDPVQAALGEQVKLPTDGKSQITYRLLANHRSSLPRLPDDLIATADIENPYVHYDQGMLYACLNRMESVKPIGTRTRYSNFGVGLLGHALGKLAGSGYRTALKERVLVPLGMLSTSAESSDDQSARLATAHQKKGKTTKHWDFSEATVAAGGVRSSLADMFKFLRANIDPATSELAEEIVLMRQPSKLPQHESRLGKHAGWFVPVGYLVTLAIIILGYFGTPWLTRVGPGGLLFFLIVLLPTLGVVCRWGRIPGAVTLVLMTFVTWCLWGFSVDTFAMLVMGASSIHVFSRWKTSWPKFVKQLQGEGRLAWQSSEVGSHPMLWHNGMVGGSASFLGIVEALEIGVIVLTNTAKSVDALGVKILSELVKVKENESRLKEKDSQAAQ